MFKSRKGITPLVATILLVAFSVGLGTLVMSWGQDYIEEKAEFVQGTSEVRSGCDAAQIKVIQISGVPQLCYGQQGIDLWIDNGADVDVYNVHAMIVGLNGVTTVDEILPEPLLKLNAQRVIIPYDQSVGQIAQIKLTPKIWTGKEVVACPQTALTLEYILPCTV